MISGLLRLVVAPREMAQSASLRRRLSDGDAAYLFVGHEGCPAAVAAMRSVSCAGASFYEWSMALARPFVIVK
jgi:hypothetical protein